MTSEVEVTLFTQPTPVDASYNCNQGPPDDPRASTKEHPSAFKVSPMPSGYTVLTVAPHDCGTLLSPGFFGYPKIVASKLPKFERPKPWPPYIATRFFNESGNTEVLTERNPTSLASSPAEPPFSSQSVKTLAVPPGNINRPVGMEDVSSVKPERAFTAARGSAGSTGAKDVVILSCGF